MQHRVLMGQDRVIEHLLDLYVLPNLTILLAPRGAGKTYIMNEFVKASKSRILQDEYRLIPVGNGIDDVRTTIEESIGLGDRTIFLFTDGDNMSIPAMNSLLKLAEEPPKNCHIVLELSDLANTLPTILSRGSVITLEPYSKETLSKIAVNMELDINSAKVKAMIDIAETPGDLIRLSELDFDSCYEYCAKVYNNILRVSTGNAFKICDKIDFKGPGGNNLYPIDIFYRVFLYMCHIKLRTEPPYAISYIIKSTTRAINSLRKKGVNKNLVFDIWVLDCRLIRG